MPRRISTLKQTMSEAAANGGACEFKEPARSRSLCFHLKAGEPENGEEDLGTFASAAETLWRAGLAPIPVGGEDGKVPLVTRFTKWKRRPGLNVVRKWIVNYPAANVGVVTGPLSRVSVVDVDSADPMVQQQMVERFGDTLLKTQTPRGGCHLWYRYNGEAS